jgi:hypothetical protein
MRALAAVALVGCATYPIQRRKVLPSDSAVFHRNATVSDDRADRNDTVYTANIRPLSFSFISMR